MVTQVRGKPYGLQDQIYRRWSFATKKAARLSREGRLLESSGNERPREMTITLETRNRIPLMLLEKKESLRALFLVADILSRQDATGKILI